MWKRCYFNEIYAKRKLRIIIYAFFVQYCEKKLPKPGLRHHRDVRRLKKVKPNPSETLSDCVNTSNAHVLPIY